MKKIIIMMGPPGSGKGTQAKLLAEKYGYQHISTGDLLRQLADKPDPTAEEQQVLADIQVGKLAPNELIYKLVFGIIKQILQQGRGVVLDGAIRNLEQAQDFQAFFEENGLSDKVVTVAIALSDEDAFQRLVKRRICSDCGTSVPCLPSNQHITACPRCGGALEIRQDDNPNIIQERIVKQGNTALQPILDYYHDRRVLRTVNGNQSIETVAAEIETVLTEHYVHISDINTPRSEMST